MSYYAELYTIGQVKNGKLRNDGQQIRYFLIRRAKKRVTAANEDMEQTDCGRMARWTILAMRWLRFTTLANVSGSVCGKSNAPLPPR